MKRILRLWGYYALIHRLSAYWRNRQSEIFRKQKRKLSGRRQPRRKLRGGRPSPATHKEKLCVQTHAQASALPGPGLAIGVMAFLLLAISTSVYAKHEAYRDSITPLQIGDIVPAEWWDIPLTLWSAADNSTETITLNNYRGKVIILDFWATWCKSCIANMPRMHRLQAGFHQDMVVLPVTYENANTVAAFLGRTADTGMVALRESFQSVIADSVLKALFPNPDKSIPYFAIIRKDGVFKGLTIPQHLDENLISQLADGEDGYVPELRQISPDPFLQYAPSYAGNQLHKPLYYAMVSGYWDGYTYRTGVVIDSVNNVHRTYYVNQPLLTLYNAALRSGSPNLPNRRLLLVDSAVQYESHNLRNPHYNAFQHSYCYESVYPASMARHARLERMVTDLNMASGLYGALLKREIPCLVIRLSGSDPKPAADLPGGTSKRLPLKALTQQLNRQYQAAIPYVIDETGYMGEILWDKALDRSDIQAIRACLARQGFELIEESRELEIFVLSDRKVDDVSGIPIALTKYGYVRKEAGNE
ncbi:TlpA family protein disulfide reductase [Parapedobacter koreensis]|uniref:AhpC/TSA family protein n=1 Tax=Parapedobacter koreensis TaxID=332977 RepID=A0A1H7U995_9SPHI|nr:TlpA family protein disulfide reductase [Parapedobacter koreensis]SEL93650.1 AhpC/TSA family protein [Parapedobacter koreensis]